MEKVNPFIFESPKNNDRQGFHPWDIITMAAVTNPELFKRLECYETPKDFLKASWKLISN